MEKSPLRTKPATSGQESPSSPEESPEAVARMFRSGPGSRQGGAEGLSDVFGDPDRNEARVGESLDPAAGKGDFKLPFE